MVAAVIMLPLLSVAQPEVRAAVDHDHVVRQLIHDRRGGAMGQSEEDDLVTGQRLRGGLDEHTAGQRGEVWVDVAEPGARAGGRGECTH